MALPRRLSGSLPLSIAIHAVVLAILVVIPLTAEMALPIPSSAIDDYIRAVPAPAPPPAPAPASARRVPDVAPATVPTHAPDTIAPEVERPPATPDLAIEGGVGAPAALDGSGGVVDPLAPPAPVPPPPPAKPEGPVRAGELVQMPRRLVDARPLYPDIARRARVEGTVVLEAVLDRSGHVSQVRVVKSVPLLDQAAIDAVRQWRYTPSTLHGIPIEVLMTVTVTFRLQD
jgi:protein TonB